MMKTDDHVQHKLFGQGTILAIDGFGDTAKLTIKFNDEKDTKIIISKYVKLVKKVTKK